MSLIDYKMKKKKKKKAVLPKKICYSSLHIIVMKSTVK